MKSHRPAAPAKGSSPHSTTSTGSAPPTHDNSAARASVPGGAAPSAEAPILSSLDEQDIYADLDEDNAMFDPVTHGPALAPSSPSSPEPPPPAPPEVVVAGETRGVGIVDRLSAEREELRAQDRRDQRTRQDLQDRIDRLGKDLRGNALRDEPLSADELTAKRQARAKVQAELAAVESRIDANRSRQGVINQDVEALTNPATPPSERSAILKRHSADIEMDDEVATDEAKPGLASAREQSSYKDGHRIVHTESEQKKGFGRSETKEAMEFEAADGSKGRMYREEKKGPLQSEVVQGRSKTSEHDGDKRIETEEERHRRTLGESEDIYANSQQIGDQKHSEERSQKTGIDRGVISQENKKTVSNMKVDEDGNDVQGWKREHANTGKVGLDDGELKGEADHKSAVTRQHSKDVSTKAFAGAGFSVALKIEKKDGVFYVITTVTLRAQGGVGVDGKKGGGTAGLSAEASGSMSMSTRKVLEPDAYEAYLGHLDAAASGSSGGGSRELAVIYTAATKGPEAAYNTLIGAKAQLGDAREAAALREGEAVQLDTTGKAEAKGALGGEQGQGKVGVSATAGAGRDRQVLVERKDGKIIVTIMMRDTNTLGAGASAGMGSHVSGSYSQEETVGTVRTMRIELDPHAADFDAKYEALVGADNQEELNQATANLSGDEVSLDSDGTVDSGSSTVGMKVGPGGLDITQGHEFTDNYVIEDGEVKRKVTGGNSGGAEAYVSLGALGPAGWLAKQVLDDDKLKIGAKSKDQLAVTVDQDGEVSADLTRERESYDSFRGKDKENTEGLHVRGDQWSALAGLAADPEAWDVHNGGATSNREAWLELGRAVRAAKGDPEKIAVAAARYMDAGNHKSKEILHDALRAHGTVNDTLRFELPPEVDKLKPRLEAYVFGGGSEKDPRAVLDALEVLRQDLTAHKAAFENPASYADLMNGIRMQKAKARERLRAQRGGGQGGSMWDSLPGQRPKARPPGPNDRFDPNKPPATGGLTTGPSGMDALEDSMEAIELEEGTWNDLTAALDGYKAAEDNAFGQIEKLVVDRVPSVDDLKRKGQLISNILEVHARWKPDLEAARTEGNRLGEDVSGLPRPNKELLGIYSNPNDQRGKIPSSEVQDAKKATPPRHGGGSSRRAQTEAELEAEYQRQQRAVALSMARSKLNTARSAATNANKAATGLGNTVNNNYVSKGSYPEAARLLEEGRKPWAAANQRYLPVGAMDESTEDAIASKAAAYDQLAAQYQQAQGLFAQALQAAKAGR